MSRTNWFKFLKHVYDELSAVCKTKELVERDLIVQTVQMNSDKIPLQTIEAYKEQYQ